MGSLKCICTFTTCAPRSPNDFPSHRRTGALHMHSPSSSVKVSRETIEITEEDVFLMFLQEREQTGDFISKVCDRIWHKSFSSAVGDPKWMGAVDEFTTQKVKDRSDNGFLKMSALRDWVGGDMQPPINEKQMYKDFMNDSESRKKLDFLKYEALKRELVVLSIAIGTLCTGYCLAIFSVQTAVSYAIGVLFSCLYLQLLYGHVDILSTQMVPKIFVERKPRKIGIRSEDLRDGFEKWVRGSGIALSSPRLMVPSAIYALWAFSHHFGADEYFNFQLVPAMMGMFVYKAAALVQVYRDNEDLQIVFPEDQ